MATEEKARYTRANLVILDVFTQMMRDLLLSMVQPISLIVMTSHNSFKRLLKKHEAVMLTTIRASDYKEFDIGLIYKIIRFFKFIQAPSRGWGYAPTTGDINIADDVERVRITRNSFMHKPNPVLSEQEMNSAFIDFLDIGNRFDLYLNKDPNRGYKSAVDKYRTSTIDPESEKKYMDEIHILTKVQSELNQMRRINIYFGREMKDVFADDGIKDTETKLKVYLPDVVDPAVVTTILTSMIMDIIKMNYEIILDNVGEGSLVLYITVSFKRILNCKHFLEALVKFLICVIVKANIQFSNQTDVDAIVVVSDPLIDHVFHKIGDDFDVIYDVDSVRRIDGDMKGRENFAFLADSFKKMTFSMADKRLGPLEVDAELIEQATKQNMENTKNELRLIMIGKTGVGKSALGNFICGKEEFHSEIGSSSVTKYCKHGQCVFNNRPVIIIDTPGIFGTEHDSTYVESQIRKCIGMGSPGPHAILFVMTLGDRFKEEDVKAIREFLKFFGKNMLDYVLVVFTHADVLKHRGKTLEEHLEGSPQKLKDLLKLCGNRYIALNNNSTGFDREIQLKALYAMIDNLKLNIFEDENFRSTEKLLAEREKEIATEVERRLKIKEEEMEAVNEKLRQNFVHDAFFDLLRPIQKEALQRLITVRDEVRTEIEQNQLQFVLNVSRLNLHKSILKKFPE